MNALVAILICDSDAYFREGLQNFLLAAGYPDVELAATVRDAIATLREKRYSHVMIGVSQPFSCERRWAAVIRRRQPAAKIVFLLSAADRPSIRVTSCEHVIKENMFSSLLDLL
jgi:DNA-binding NarL/FixJ family response regulator